MALARSHGLGRCPRCILRGALDLASLGEEKEASEGILNWPTDPGGRTVRFGDYELLDEVARGGMGVVYRARQRSLGRTVALKVLLGGAFAGPEGRNRLMAEASAAARLQHPSIVAVHEAGSWEGQPFYTMEFIEGRTLAAAIRSGPLPVARAVQYVATVAEAIQYAHDQGVLHRDLKPSNVLIDVHDRPRIADFGLARRLDPGETIDSSAERPTLTGQVLGSPAYMPPEQAFGRREEVGPASDVYSLGAILYEALASRPPFQGNSPQAIIEQVRSDDPVAPRRLNASLPVDLETICLKCLEKSPAHRYPSAKELAEDLHRFLRGEPVRARPLGSAKRAWRWVGRNPSLSMLGLISIGLLLALGMVAMTGAMRVRASRDEAQARLAEALVSEARAVRIAAEAGHRATVLDLVEQARDLDPAGRLRARAQQEAIAALALPDERRVVLKDFPSSVDPMLVCFDPRFEKCALWDETAKNFAIRTVPQGILTATVTAPRADEIVSFSADGRFLMLRHRDQVSVWSAVNGSVVLTAEASEGSDGLAGGAFGTAGRWFGRGERGGRFVLYDWSEIAGARPAHAWPIPGGSRIGSVCWSGDGGWVAFTTQEGRLAVCKAESGEVRWDTRPTAGRLWGVAWNDPRHWVAVQAEGDRLLVFDALTGEEVHRLHTPTDASARVAFSPDGDRMATSTERFGTRMFASATGRMMRDDPAASWHLHFDLEGRRLGTLFDQGKPAWREWMPSVVMNSLDATASANNQVLDFSPDGAWLCTLSSTGPRVWDVARRRIETTVAFKGADYAVFDADPRRLLASAGGTVLSIDWRGSLETPTTQVIARGKGFWGIAISRTRDLIALTDHKGGEVLLLDGRYRRVGTFGPVELPGYVAFSPDGRWLAVVGGRDLWVWDLNAGSQAPWRGEGSEPTPRFSPDGRWLLTQGREIQLRQVGQWDVAISLPLAPNPAGGTIAAFSPDGRWLAATQRDREVHLLDFATRKLLAVLEGSGEGRIVDLTFGPRGDVVVAARERGEVQVWQVPELRRALQKLRLDWE